MPKPTVLAHNECPQEICIHLYLCFYFYRDITLCLRRDEQTREVRGPGWMPTGLLPIFYTVMMLMLQPVSSSSIVFA